jgi:hypothetical protein
MKKMNVIETDHGKFHVISKHGRLIRFARVLLWESTKNTEWNSVSEIFKTMEESNYSYTYTREFPTGKTRVLFEGNDPRKFKEQHPEYMI